MTNILKFPKIITNKYFCPECYQFSYMERGKRLQCTSCKFEEKNPHISLCEDEAAKKWETYKIELGLIRDSLLEFEAKVRQRR